MSFYTINTKKNRKLYYQILGETGPRLVMIHGSMNSHRQWAYQHPLAEQAVLTLLDLPGHGQSDSLPDLVTVPNITFVLSNFFRESNLIPVIPVGHSLGGAIALQLVLDYPEIVNGLILVGTGAKLGVFPAILDGLRTHYEDGINLAIGQLAFHENSSPDLIEQAKREALQCSKSIGLADFLACNAFDVRTRLQEIKVPTLILVGDQDKLTPPKWASYLNDHISGSTLEVMKNAGHFVMQEQPKAVNSAISHFLDNHNWEEQS